MIEFSLGRDMHRMPRLGLELVGTDDVFRFAVNMLSMQVEFCRAARAILVELREMTGPVTFDPWAKSLLGKDRYEKLSGYFLRDDHCLSCERLIKDGEPHQKLSDAAIACIDCARWAEVAS